MIHFVFLFLLLNLLTAALTCGLFIASYRLILSSEQKSLLTFFINIFLVFFLNFIEYALRLGTDSFNIYLQYSIIFLKVGAISGAIYTITKYTHILLKFAGHVRFLFGITSIVFIIGLIFIFPLELLNHTGVSYLTSYITAINVSFALMCTYCTLLVLFRLKFIANKTNKKYALFSTLLCPILILMIVLAELGIPRSLFHETYYILQTVFNTIYAFWLIVSLRYGIRLISLHTDSSLTHQNAPAYGLDLSNRERQVFHLMLKGLSNNQIAEELCVSLSTVKTHTNRIYKKSGSENRTELLKRWSETE